MAVLICHCAYSQVISESIKQQVVEVFRETGVTFSEVADLCELAARRDSLFKRLGETQNLKIIACYPRTIKWLFAASGSTMPADTEVFNMRADSSENILSRLNSTEAKSKIDSDLVVDVTLNQKGQWEPWFPVIDYDRCIDCKQCLNFCLFGVFAPTEQGKVVVQNPQNCKTNCPACARVCPEVAILFPKFPDAPINGAEVCDGDVDGKKSGVQITDTLKGDIYDKLRQRSKTAGERFAVIQDPDLAEQERCKCARLAKLKQDLNIPDEVIQSLRGAKPSSQEPAEGCDCDCSTDSDCDCDCSDPTEPRGEGCCCD